MPFRALFTSALVVIWIVFPVHFLIWVVSAKFNIIKTKYLQPVVFTEHMRCITALCFGNKIEPILLASGSEDCVIVWFLENDASFDG